MNVTQLVLAELAVLTLIVGVIDARTRHIPNRLLLVGLLLGAPLHGVSYFIQRPAESAVQTLLAALLSVFAGLLLCAALPLFLFRVNAMGGGDVKLLAVIGATAGPFVGMEIELYSLVLLALFAPIRLAYQGQLLRALANSVSLAVNVVLPKARRRPVPPELMTALPLGPAVFVATVLVSLPRVWHS